MTPSVHPWPGAVFRLNFKVATSRLGVFAVRASLSFVLMIPLPIFGKDPVTKPIVPPPDAANGFDAPRDYLSDKIVGWGQGIDRFFGDDRHFQESSDSVLQLDISRVTGYEGDQTIVLEGRGKFALPNTEKKAHFVVESDPDSNTVVAPGRVRTPRIRKIRTPVSYGAALRFEKVDIKHWHFSADAGLKMQGLSSPPFVRARASLTVPLDNWNLMFTETAFWFNNIGVGASTQFDLERPISEPLLFRFGNSATWLNDPQNFDLREDVSLYHQLNERTALLYQASMVGVSNPQTQVTEYVVLMLYRYRLHRHWVYVEVSPQIHYPIESDFQTSALLSLKLELLLDKSR